MAFKDDVIPAISFEDKNFESYKVTLLRTSFADKNVDVTEKFVAGHVKTDVQGGSGSFDTFEKNPDNDGIYTMTVELKDKAGHIAEKNVTFTVNRYGSVYEYNDYLVSLIVDGGAYVQAVDHDLVITEYNPDRLLSDSLDIEISKDGKPLDESNYTVAPEINDVVALGQSGWFQYEYVIDKENFDSDGVYKIAISSKDATGNTPENINYEDKEILFRVDSTVPEITSITGLEDAIVNATEQNVKYSVFDAMGLESVIVYVNESEILNITNFEDDINNYTGEFKLEESSSAQTVRIVVKDIAGNITDTASEEFTSSYVFNDSVTVSTNALIRWYANKTLFYSSIIGSSATISGCAAAITFFKRRRLKFKKTE